MPIRPEERDRYPDDWKEISRRIRFDRAGGQCECVGQCGNDHDDRCAAPNGESVVRHRSEPWRWRPWADVCEEVFELTGCVGEDHDGFWSRAPIKVVLTVAHLDHTPENCDEDNLLALCQRCHLRLDREHHARTARATRDRKAGQENLF